MSPTTSCGARGWAVAVRGEDGDDRPDRVLVAVEPVAEVRNAVRDRVPGDPVRPLDGELRAADEMTCVREPDRRGAVPVDLGSHGRRRGPRRRRCRTGAPCRRNSGSGSSSRAGPRRKVRLGGSSWSAAPSRPPLDCRNAAIGSIVDEPMTRAIAGTVRVARRRLRADLAASRRRLDSSSPFETGHREEGSSAWVANADSSASGTNGFRGCSLNQSTSVSNHTSSRNQAIGIRPS